MNFNTSAGGIYYVQFEEPTVTFEELLTPTKQYYANNQLLALRLEDDSLNHVLYDPTGLSMTIADESGILVGRILYDSFGSVLSNTLPLTVPPCLCDPTRPSLPSCLSRKRPLLLQVESVQLGTTADVERNG